MSRTSLLGIFGVNMPLIYGENNGAFLGLQKEILQNSPDESIFAWKDRHCSCEGRHSMSRAEFRFWYPGFLVTSPRSFADASLIRRTNLSSRRPYTITNQGLEFWSEAVRVEFNLAFKDTGRQDRTGAAYVVDLNCEELDDSKRESDTGPSRRPCRLVLYGYKPKNAPTAFCDEFGFPFAGYQRGVQGSLQPRLCEGGGYIRDGKQNIEIRASYLQLSK
ncbi:hypothetical protein LTR86_008784 [Recurvomyces mirabilis]|nr:hypothetical protein LTR86_008784 [Recurvomyces mirabilis]